MVNIKKLKAKVIEKGTTLEKVAKSIGIDPSTLYRKIKNDGATLTIKEATNIANVLKFNALEVNEIFFAGFVA